MATNTPTETALTQLWPVASPFAPMRPHVPSAVSDRVADAVLGAQQAIDDLVGASTLTELYEQAPRAAARIGFTRALLSRVDEGIWLAQAAYAHGNPEFAHQLVQFGVAHSRHVTGRMMESEMLRSGSPILVEDARSNPRVHTELIQFARTASYVAAPVQAWSVPVAMVHADRYPDCTVDEIDCRLLGVFAKGLGLAIERAQLANRLRIINQASSQYLSGVDVIAGESDNATRFSMAAAPSRRATASSALRTERAGERLSPREWDVLRSIALGNTNAQIAVGLFLTEHTVKTHVKRILRKLGACNRTEAAAIYHRLIPCGA